jgi:hypothetical protein
VTAGRLRNAEEPHSAKRMNEYPLVLVPISDIF